MQRPGQVSGIKEDSSPLNSGNPRIERKLVPHFHLSPREMASFLGKAYMSSWCQLSQSRYNGISCLGMRGPERTTLSFPWLQRGMEELLKFSHLIPNGMSKLACRARTTGLQRRSLARTDGDWVKKPSYLSGLPA